MRQDVQDVLSRHRHTVPVNVRALAEDLGLKVWESRRLPPQISGKLSRRNPALAGPSGLYIVVNGNDGYYRKRFTVAHEIAHFLYHDALIGPEIADDVMYRSGLPSPVEFEANRLGADLLMPARSIYSEIANGAATVERLAERFEVSRAAMKVRLGELDIPLPDGAPPEIAASRV